MRLGFEVMLGVGYEGGVGRKSQINCLIDGHIGERGERDSSLNESVNEKEEMMVYVGQQCSYCTYLRWTRCNGH